MTTPGNRFKGYIEGLSVAWRDQLKTWVAGVVGFGLEVFADVIGKKLSSQLQPMIAKIEANTTIPPELQPLWNEIKAPSGEVAALLANRVGGGIVGGAVGTMMDWLLRPMVAGMTYNPTFYIHKADILIGAWRRHLISKDNLYELERYQGIDPAHVDELIKLSELRFPSEIVVPLWLRNKDRWDRFWDDVKQIGVDDDHILALKELAYRVPGSGDVIRYMVKEVYNPTVYKAFGQDQEFPGGAGSFTADPLQDAEASGVRKEHLLKEWIAHWVLPSSGQGFDLLHRGEITEDQLGMLLKALDIMPFWRDKLTALSWEVPNRVELRLLARYGLVDKAFLVEALKKAGLHQDYRDILADLMLAQGMLTDFSKRYANKWINSDELKKELDAVGLSQLIKDRMYTWIIKNNAGERIAAQKDLTAAEIIKGVKKNILTWDEGVSQLMALGYDEVEADYKMAIDVEVTPEATTPDLTVKIDTIRRQRRQRLIDRPLEISMLLDLNVDSALAIAYADNDDLRLVKLPAVKAPEVLLEYQTAAGKVQVESVRLSRRQDNISRLEEITSLVDLGMAQELAVSIADNDELRVSVPVPVPVPVVPLAYQTEVGKAQADNIRLTARSRKLTQAQTPADIAAGITPVVVSGDEAKAREIELLMALDMSEELAAAYAENDELRLVKITGV